MLIVTNVEVRDGVLVVMNDIFLASEDDDAIEDLSVERLTSPSLILSRNGEGIAE